MSIKTVFKRYELKFLITAEEKNAILRAMEPHTVPDEYGKTTIRNLYFDTPSYRLIRSSIEKPLYKEKMRIRSYKTATPDSTVFVELKKKFDGVVYKRRIALPEAEAMAWTCGDAHTAAESQIVREIDYFMYYYGTLRPVIFLSYDREAYFEKDDSDFRITFDENILSRPCDLSLTSPVYGDALLEPSLSLMEIKCHGAIPLWMARTLSDMGIYKTSFSKYGTAYRNFIFPEIINRNSNVHNKEPHNVNEFI